MMSKAEGDGMMNILAIKNELVFLESSLLAGTFEGVIDSLKNIQKAEVELRSNLLQSFREKRQEVCSL